MLCFFPLRAVLDHKDLRDHQAQVVLGYVIANHILIVTLINTMLPVLQGEQGAQGAKGKQGPTGAKGPAGPPGDPGRSGLPSQQVSCSNICVLRIVCMYVCVSCCPLG